MSSAVGTGRVHNLRKSSKYGTSGSAPLSLGVPAESLEIVVQDHEVEVEHVYALAEVDEAKLCPDPAKRLDARSSCSLVAV